MLCPASTWLSRRRVPRQESPPHPLAYLLAIAAATGGSPHTTLPTSCTLELDSFTCRSIFFWRDIASVKVFSISKQGYGELRVSKTSYERIQSPHHECSQAPKSVSEMAVTRQLTHSSGDC